MKNSTSFRLYILLLILFFPILNFSQNCSNSLSGNVKDLKTGLPLKFVNVYIVEESKGTYTDSIGSFHFSNLCVGEYHIFISHIGCEGKKIHVDVANDTILNLFLEHTTSQLEEALIVGQSSPNTTQSSETISEQKITDNSNENLSNLLESIPGVSTLKTGSGVSKPVVHGLYGNRLTILNNGVSQSGQQWGNDHSPEIDPLVANKIRVIKGTSALEYLGSNLGSVILVEPKKIENDPHLHGRVNYFFESNGLSNGLNVQLEKYSPKLAWKVNGTLKKSGDKKTATYFLTNTGSQEANVSLQLEKSFSKKLTTELYFSSFNTELGVLRGAHIGNLTDLEDALERDIPFYTEDNFSYNIDVPKQQVHHQLLKLHSKYFINDTQWLDFTIAGQLNNRKEFDVRRSGRSDIPALSLQQYSFFVEGKHQKIIKNSIKIKSGFQFNFIDNTNNPETGISPLIPDYLSYETGAFFIASKKVKKSLIELGARYDYVLLNSVTITQEIPRSIVHNSDAFNNFSASGGWIFTPNKNWNYSYNVGVATRSPAINELYSQGLHQGVSGIEEGSEDLKIEKSLKTTLGINGELSDKLSLESLIYYQKINDYIYLNPQDEIRLTIRGAFPVFIYEQTDANIYGIDVITKYQLNKSFHAFLEYSFIKANEQNTNLPLINFPSNNIKGSIVYEFFMPIKVGKLKLENQTVELSNAYVFKQNNIEEGQDFVLPPDSYNLLGVKLATNIQLKKNRLRLTAKVDNLLNVKYRNYLNRQRYFADDLGINVVFGCSLKL